MLIPLFIALLISFVHIFFPTPGFAFLAPVFLHFYDPNVVIAVLAFYFFLSCLARLAIFHMYIEWRLALLLIPGTLVGAVIGSLLSGFLPMKLLTLLLIGASLHFIFRKVFPKAQSFSFSGKYTEFIMGIITGFFQSLGLGGSVLRASYLFSQGLSLQSFHATTALIAVFSLFPAFFIRAIGENLPLAIFLPFLWAFPLMLLATWIGKKVILKIPKKIGDRLLITAILISIIALIPKLF